MLSWRCWPFSFSRQGVTMFRKMMGRAQSRQNFTRNAVRHHVKNTRTAPMRGGIRL